MRDDERAYMIVTTPFLFCNFVERQTRDQRGWRDWLKSAAMWTLNWKGYRDR